MTATTNAPLREERRPTRRIRISSMESLGFSDAERIWSDSPIATPAPTRPRGRHLAPSPDPDPIASWQPEEFGSQLSRGNLRWSLLIGAFLTLAIAGGIGLWLYQRPAAEAAASVNDLTNRAQQLSAVLADLETFNTALTDNPTSSDPAELFVVDGAARNLFEAAGHLASTESDLRADAAAAAGSTLDGIRLAGDAHAYRLAVRPVLSAPELQADPSLIELDEAARMFGEWQLRFDNVRSALPDGVLTDVTNQLDVLSGDLNTILGTYVDALRQDDQQSVSVVLVGLGERMIEIDQALTASLGQVQERVAARIAEAVAALEAIEQR